MKELAFGIDIGGTNTVIGLVDKQGVCLTKNKIITKDYDDIDLFIKDLAEKIKETESLIKEKNIIRGIGIGAPNGNYYNGTIEEAPNLKWKGIIPVVQLIKKHFNYPSIVLTNDANAAAIGEMIYGGAKNMKDFIMITLGTGVGSGIVVNGELVYGFTGLAGELGHTIVVCSGRQCGCGRQGCLETYASATGIIRTVYELLANSTDPSEIREIAYNDLEAKMIFKAAENGDKIALKAFEFTGEILGKALANSVAHTNPEAIFLFGGLAEAGEIIFKPTKKHLEDNLLNVYKNKVKLLASELEGSDAAILGASALVWKEIES